MKSTLRVAPAGLGHHPLGEIHAGHARAALRRGGGERARAATDVQHAVPRPFTSASSSAGMANAVARAVSASYVAARADQPARLEGLERGAAGAGRATPTPGPAPSPRGAPSPLAAPFIAPRGQFPRGRAVPDGGSGRGEAVLVDRGAQLGHQLCR